MKLKSKYFVLFFIAILSTIILSELILRTAGFKPGKFYSFKDMENSTVDFNTDTVFPVNFFKSDSLGILRIITDSFVRKNIGDDKMLSKYRYYFEQVSINKDGYRGEESETKTIEDRILLCGDSYTFGYSALPIDSCFADILQQKLTNYKVYNAGVPGVDIATYNVILKQLIPLLKPKIVILNFFSGNDFIYYNKKLKPYANNDIFLMNVGGIMNVNYDSYHKDSIEIFKTHVDAYSYLRNKYYVNKNNNFNNFIAQSSVFTQLYKLVKSNASDYTNVNIDKYKFDKYATEKQFLEIQKLCKNYNCRLIISIIPDETDVANLKPLINKLDNEFQSAISFSLIKDLKLVDYAIEPYDTHFNNNGHRKYAAYLMKLINENINE